MAQIYVNGLNSMRICKACGIDKDINAFDKNRLVCKTCQSNKNRANVLKWQETHADRTREIKKLSQRKYRQTHKEEIKAQKSKTRAIRHGNSGSHTAKEWADLQAKYNNCCLRCGRSDVPLTKDHVMPITKGGTDNITNIQPLCRSCNSSKNDTYIDYR